MNIREASSFLTKLITSYIQGIETIAGPIQFHVQSILNLVSAGDFSIYANQYHSVQEKSCNISYWYISGLRYQNQDDYPVTFSEHQTSTIENTVPADHLKDRARYVIMETVHASAYSIQYVFKSHIQFAFGFPLLSFFQVSQPVYIEIDH